MCRSKVKSFFFKPSVLKGHYPEMHFKNRLLYHKCLTGQFFLTMSTCQNALMCLCTHVTG